MGRLLEDYPEVAAIWHPKKNGNLKPNDVQSKSNKMAWWYMPYDDPKTGKHFEFEWETPIYSQVKKRGCLCPFIDNSRVWKGYNDLATKCPSIAKQWHPKKNGDLTPADVVYRSGKSVWWYMPYDDPETGKHFDFEWKQSIATKTQCGDKPTCPYITGKRVWPGYNDLATKRPPVAEQWHPTKNGNLRPENVGYGSHKKAWWLYPYDDPETGKHFDFEWEAMIYARKADGNDCPYITGTAVWPGYNDLLTKHPEVAKLWHPEKNNGLTPREIREKSEKSVWWFYPYDDPETGKHFDFEWKGMVSVQVARNMACPYLDNSKLWIGFNDLATKCPSVAKQWHPQKNNGLTPRDVVWTSVKKAWWLYPYDDPETGKHFDFEWQARIDKRVKAEGTCPFLTKRVWPGYNDLATKCPSIAEQWHPRKNKGLTPQDVMWMSSKRAWWLYPYDDPKTGKHFDFEWQAIISNRTHHQSGCPYLENKKVLAGFNDLATNYPEIAKEWNYKKNKNKTPDNVCAKGKKKVWWICSKCGYEWLATIDNRTTNGSGCPRCAKKNLE